MRPWIFVLVLVSSSIGITACAARPPVRGTPQAFAFACARPNIGQVIAVEGYLRLPPSLDSSKQVTLRLYPDPSMRATPIGVVMPFGDGPNEAHKISSSYRDSDLRVRLADGTPVAFGTRVRVSGRMFLPLQPEDYSCALQNPYLEPAN